MDICRVRTLATIEKSSEDMEHLVAFQTRWRNLNHQASSVTPCGNELAVSLLAPCSLFMPLDKIHSIIERQKAAIVMSLPTAFLHGGLRCNIAISGRLFAVGNNSLRWTSHMCQPIMPCSGNDKRESFSHLCPRGHEDDRSYCQIGEMKRWS
ncbi:hypothetical protein KC347_g252 [Hortaea werneckii]|nr:hypothetical protein KC347_g252 [Hortaea werneckii]